MVQKEIEEEYEETHVETKTITDTVTFCDGCTDECDDGYVTLTNITIECLEKIETEADAARVLENSEEFHICSGCQRGLREHERTLDTALYEAPGVGEDSKNSAKSKNPNKKFSRISTICNAIGMSFVLLAFAAFVGPLPSAAVLLFTMVGMVFASVSHILEYV